MNLWIASHSWRRGIGLLTTAALFAACTPAAPAAPTASQPATTAPASGQQPAASTKAPPAAAGQAASALGTVSMRIEGDWAHLDPLGRLPGGGLQTGLLLDSLYDALVIIGPNPQDPSKPALIPYLATKWDQSP